MTSVFVSDFVHFGRKVFQTAGVEKFNCLRAGARVVEFLPDVWNTPKMHIESESKMLVTLHAPQLIEKLLVVF